MIPEQGYPDMDFGAWVAGTVKQPDGRPVTGAAVTVTVPDTGLQVGSARSAPSGTYKVGLARGGTYLVIVSAPGRRPAADLVAAGDGPTRHDVVLGGSGVLAGVARMADAGDPVPGAVVTLTDARGQVVAAGTTAADGEYRLDGLDAGDYTLAGTAPGMRPVARAVTVPGTEDLTFAAPAHRVSAIVTGPGGAPFAGAVVTLSGSDGDVATQVSDGHGSVTFTDIPVGGYALAAEGTGPGVAVALAVRGRVARADIRLGSPARASVTSAMSSRRPEDFHDHEGFSSY
jgi:hypothetical protein